MFDLKNIAVIGLGYVGLPLAVHLARHYPVTGLDIDSQRVQELKTGQDRTNEIDTSALKASTLEITDQISAIENTDVFIVTVPTPVDSNNEPDLTAVRGASKLVGGVLKKGDIVVYESTVYPGVTEDVAGPELEAASGLVCGTDFFLGYSPERINPGDKEHTVDKITKVIAGQNADVTKVLSEIYGRLTSGGIFVAKDIRTAEAAKVIENAQRDINIAFINEVTKIFQKMNLSVHDVLEAAGTKWNFLKFKPGLVGGHCIGVDPYYLTHKAKGLGLNPELILAGRRINDEMPLYVASKIIKLMTSKGLGIKNSKILVLGFTFKENCPDIRNTKVVDLVNELIGYGCTVDVTDPLAVREEVLENYGIELFDLNNNDLNYDLIVKAVAHDSFLSIDLENFQGLTYDITSTLPKSTQQI